MNFTSPFITVQEIAEYLKVSKMTVYRMLHAGVIPSITIGTTSRMFRVERDKFDEWLKAQSR